MKRWLAMIMVLVMASWVSASTLIIDGKVVEGTVTITTSSAPPPPVTCPTGKHWDETQAKCIDDPLPPPVSGQWTKQIAGAYKCNQRIMNLDGSATSFGYGFYNNLNPSGAYVQAGKKVYFLLDPSWISSLYSNFKIRWIDFIIVPGLKINIYKIDASDNGPLDGSSGSHQGYFVKSREPGIRYLLEADATQCASGFSLTVFWP